MIVVGIDLSLNGTGLARYEGGVLVATKRIAVKMPKGATRDQHHARLERIEDEVAQFATGADLAVMEGISYGSFDEGKRIAGAHWIIQHRLWEDEIPYAEVSSSTRQKYVTGTSGKKVTKQMIVDAVNSGMFGEIFVETDDEADAVVFAAIAHRAFGFPVDETFVANWPCIDVVDWPDIEWVVTTPN